MYTVDLEQYRFELPGSTYTQIFFSIYMVNILSLSYDFPNIFFSLAYFIVRIQHALHTTYNIY